jgi:hypothetical protein
MPGFTESTSCGSVSLVHWKCKTFAHTVYGNRDENVARQPVLFCSFLLVWFVWGATKKITTPFRDRTGTKPRIFFLRFCNQTTFIMRCDFFFHKIHETKWLECFFAHFSIQLFWFGTNNAAWHRILVFGRDESGIGPADSICWGNRTEKRRLTASHFPSLQRRSETNRWESEETAIVMHR